MNLGIDQHKKIWKNRTFLFSSFLGLILLAISLIMNNMAGKYADAHASNAVTDLLLDNLPKLNVGIIFVQGFYVFLLFLFGCLFFYPTFIPFALNSVALFNGIRSFSIILTHIKPALNPAVFSANAIFQNINFSADLFFSGHTGIPFLFALIFWKIRFLRIFFLLTSLLFGATVLLGRFHYSIDVFGAFFMTPTIFQIATKVFKKNYRFIAEHINNKTI